MASEEIKRAELEAKAAANGEIADKELDNVAGGVLYDSVGYMITTPFNSCSQWKCPNCGTYSGKSSCSNHSKEGKRWCADCKYS